MLEDGDGNIQNVDVDSLMQNIESAPTNQEVPMGQPVEGGEPLQGEHQAPAQEQVEAPQGEGEVGQTPVEILFNHNGSEIKVPLDDPRAKQWIQQGYDYAQRMAEFKQQREQFEAENGEIIGRYKEVDEFVKQNPDWWEHVNQSYLQTKQGQGHQANPDDPYSKEIQSLRQELQDLRQFKDELTQKEQAAQMEREDNELRDEIESVRKQYSDLDFSQIDDSGKSLELKVLEHAQQIGTNSFKAAFRDFYHDQLVERAAQQAKLKASEDLQKRNKLGLLGQSPTPRKGVSSAENVKNKSYESLLEEALQELGA